MAKNVFSLIFLLLIGWNVQAQRSSFTLYSGDQSAFFLVVNGIQVNAQPVANLKVAGMVPGRYQLRVVFANHTNPQLEMVQDLQPARDVTYALGRNRFGQVQPIFISEVANGIIPTPPQLLSTAVYNGPPPAPLGVVQNPQPADNPPVVIPQPNQPVLVPQPPVYEPVPNYNGPIGCDNPMTPEEFRDARNSIESKTFASSKMTLAKQIIRSNCFVADDIRTLVGLFTYESDKLEIAKFAYPFTYDQGNYYKVNDAFEFESSISKLDQFINGR